MRTETVIRDVLSLIHNADREQNYAERNRLVISLLSLAMGLGWQCGIRIDPEAPEWPVVYIELPTGQVSWHIPCYPGTWDGHLTAEKYRRVRAYHELLEGLNAD